MDAVRAATVAYLLQLADNALVLCQRNSEWVSNGPSLEEDIAQANIGLDLIGQARMLYQRAAELEGLGRTEDELAYFREASEFRNLSLLELPHFDSTEGLLAATAAHEHDYATTITRNFLYSAYMLLVWHELQRSADEGLAAIATKSLKEVRYHLRTSRDWFVRLGDGTAESHTRMQGALNHLWPYTAEFWHLSHIEAKALQSGVAVDPRALRDAWDAVVNDAIAEATLTRPAAAGFIPKGKDGLQTVHLSPLLAQMQSVARAHPEGVW
jgi:ring-1,2-phenylacetyl-CoA epoxidase subunit PaaC